MTVARAQLERGVRELGLAGLPVCLHSSLGSLGRVEGGAEDVVRAFLEQGCTVMVPTFTSWHMTLAPPGVRYERNAWDYDLPPRDWWVTDRAYSPADTTCQENMGAVAAAVAAWPGRARGINPIGSFAAVGPIAEELVGAQTEELSHSVFGALEDRHGWVVLIGVGLNRMTMLHEAETRAGREPFRRWALNPGGDPIEMQGGGCSDGFPRLEPLLEPMARTTMVGPSRWRAYPARETIARAAEAIRADPGITRCDEPVCERCDDAIAGGPIVTRRSR